jgi:hypothetical protein
MTFENIFQDYKISALYKLLDVIECENIHNGLFTFINDGFFLTGFFNVFGYNRNFDRFQLNSFSNLILKDLLYRFSSTVEGSHKLILF